MYQGPGLPPGYKTFIEKYFDIVDKDMKVIPFRLNDIQDQYISKDSTNRRDLVLKARQQGFTSIISAIFTVDFIMKPNSRSVIVANESENAMEILDKVRFYIECFEQKRSAESKETIKLPMRYDSKYEIYNEANKARYSIGTAQRTEFGRSKTILNLHLSEIAFYPNFQNIMAGALQAVTPNGRVIMETTANGFTGGEEGFRAFWLKSEAGETTFKPFFYGASRFYSKEFLDIKRKELGPKYPQEYPENPTEAFISSGLPFFDKEALKIYLDNVSNHKRLVYPEELSYDTTIS